MPDHSHLSIGEVLSLLQEEFPDVTISKIRFLESQGLVDPERTPSGYRKFYDQDIERLRWVLRQQRDAFLPLKVIKGRLDTPGAEEHDTPFTRGRRRQRAPRTEHEAPPLFDAEPPYSAYGASAGNGFTTPGVRATDVRVAAVVAPSGGSRPGRVGPAGVAAPAGSGPGRAAAREGTAPRGAGTPAEVPPPRGHAGPEVIGRSATGPSAAGPSPTGATRRSHPQEGLPDATAAPGPAPGTGLHGPLSAHAPAPEAPLPGGGARAGATAGAQVSAAARAGQPEPVGARRGKQGDVDMGGSPGGRSGRGRADAGGNLNSPGPRASRLPTRRGPVGGGGAGAEEELSLEELVELAGVGPATVKDLERFGLVTPRLVGGAATYRLEDATVARLASAFARHGLEARHLRAYKGAAEREAGLVQQVVMPLLRQRNPAARQAAADAADELAQLGGELRSVLLLAALSELR